MPPIPIYAHSPINAAAKADGVTPKTADNSHDTTPSKAPPTTTTTEKIPYPAAQPGAPAIPAPTGTSSIQQQHYIPPPQPTRTQPLGYQGPPPPQPNAFPVPSFAAAGPPPAASTTTSLPPPPKAGESAAATTTTNAQQPAYYPPQMSIPAPAAAASQSAQRGTATTISFGQAPAAPAGGGEVQNHLDRYQRSQQEALERSEQEQRLARARAPSLSEDGVWGSVKGAMAAAGEKIAAAEEEVWKRINKE